MFDYRKLPLIIIITGVVIFAFSGLFTVLNVTNSGIKMKMYLCEPEIQSAFFYNDSAVSIVDYYPKEYLYNPKSNVNDICAYKKRDFKGNLTTEKYEQCKQIYSNVTKRMYASGKCKQVGKEIFENNTTNCEALYIWRNKKLISIKCEGGTNSEREAAIKKIKQKYK